jgi:hypothetical protein
MVRQPPKIKVIAVKATAPISTRRVTLGRASKDPNLKKISASTIGRIAATNQIKRNSKALAAVDITPIPHCFSECFPNFSMTRPMKRSFSSHIMILTKFPTAAKIPMPTLAPSIIAEAGEKMSDMGLDAEAMSVTVSRKKTPKPARHPVARDRLNHSFRGVHNFGPNQTYAIIAVPIRRNPMIIVILLVKLFMSLSI